MTKPIDRLIQSAGSRRKRTLDTREPEVRNTIAAIHAMGLGCTRTPRTGEYAITKRSGDCAIVRYAYTSTEALAIAKRMLTEE